MPRDIDSLHGILKPKRTEEPPSALFAYIPQPAGMKNGVPHVTLDIEMFVRTKKLSPELQSRVSEEIRAMKRIDESKLHPLTIAEMKKESE